ncbi:hypothetical protein M1L60_41350 [Actinoplanes sp. TRM 88003]|uniref:Uncharacterized protein n=1 Tax=Paractinoplanes aksuensis TaxID=2939490 RepID=A0ABT1E4H5_9ACTN|nr:hypothetical protein [Actinoplanes aksuensis]MCO8277045.1 hypothetical protein [Actinoplanes aksuensis]
MDSPDEFVQKNAPKRGGHVYANQGTGDQIIHAPLAPRGLGADTKALLVIVAVDIVFFVVGAMSYTGKNTDGDLWRAVIFLFLVVVTVGIARRWLRRRV